MENMYYYNDYYIKIGFLGLEMEMNNSIVTFQ